MYPLTAIHIVLYGCLHPHHLPNNTMTHAEQTAYTLGKLAGVTDYDNGTTNAQCPFDDDYLENFWLDGYGDGYQSQLA